MQNNAIHRAKCENTVVFFLNLSYYICVIIRNGAQTFSTKYDIAVIIHVMLISPYFQHQRMFLMHYRIYNTTKTAYLNHDCYVTISITLQPTITFFTR